MKSTQGAGLIGDEALDFLAILYLPKRATKKTKKMQFVKTGETVKKQRVPAASILDHAQSCEMGVNLKRMLVFQDVIQTTQRLAW